MTDRVLKFAQRVQAEMKAKDIVSIRAVADKCDAKYESIRKTIQGDTSPSKHILNEICRVLGLNRTEMEALVEQDRIRLRTGKDAYAIMSGVHPGVDVINDLWESINPVHREDLQNHARMYAKQDQYAKPTQHKKKASA